MKIRMLIKKRNHSWRTGIENNTISSNLLLSRGNSTYSDNFRIREKASKNIKGLIFVWEQNTCEMLGENKGELRLIILIEQ